MKDFLPQTDELTKKSLGDSLLASHDYWLQKRILFNFIVGAVGLLATILYAPIFTIFDLMGIFMWGFIANGLYSFGYVLESYMITNHPKIKFDGFRNLLFWTGTSLYSAVSFVFAYVYYLNIETIS